ncbi:MAG TPA: hypothetical protein V6C76_01340 [Drouetiella sp.]
MDTSKASTSGNFQVLEDHKPTDETDLRARVLFLTAGIGILSSKLLKTYMDHCDEAVQSAGVQVESKVTMETYSATVKELLTVSIWLTLFEQAAFNTIPEWFKEFILSCHMVADKVQPAPTSKEIEQKYDFREPIPDICTQVAINLCMQLELGTTAPDALIYLGDLLLQAKPERAELVQFALTQPVAVLDQRIKDS